MLASPRRLTGDSSSLSGVIGFPFIGSLPVVIGSRPNLVFGMVIGPSALIGPLR